MHKPSLVLRLRRVDVMPFGTYGVLSGPDGPLVVTLERPWEDNAVGKSSIPVGTYPCKRVQSPKFGDTFEVAKVAGRSAILCHAGNSIDDSRGCILVGTTFDPVGGTNAKIGVTGVTGSKIAFDEFKDYLRARDEFTLIVSVAP